MPPTGQMQGFGGMSPDETAQMRQLLGMVGVPTGMADEGPPSSMWDRINAIAHYMGLALPGRGGIGSPTMRTLFHGEGATGGTSGRWFSTNPSRAASYGGRVYKVDVPEDVFQQGQALARKMGSGTSGDAVLHPEWLDKAELAHDIAPTVHDIPSFTP